MLRFAVSIAAIAALATVTEAQGTLSAQGLGYPAGTLSARALGSAGALAEVDALSPINPASLATVQRLAVFLQYAPEFRRVSTDETVDRSTIIRFPMIGAALPVGQRGTVSLSATTLLDRTWAATVTGTETLADQDVEFVDTYQTTGAINDVRVGASWALTPRLAVGAAGHLLTGESTLTVSRSFMDEGFVGFAQRTLIGYSGPAASVGVAWRPISPLELAASGRLGGSLRAYAGDSVIAQGSVPGRFGVGAQYTGVAGTAIAARVGWEGWSDLQNVTPDQLPANDAWEYALGVETQGPVIFGGPLPLRAGLRMRDLPFVAPVTADMSETAVVSETTLSLGTALVISAQRAVVDIAVLRSNRSGHPTVSERGWGLVLGLTVRP